MKENNIVNPNGYVTVFLPIPETYNKERLEVYQINEDGTYELIQGEIQGNYYTFTTDKLATYSLVEKPEPVTFEKMIMNSLNDVNILYIIIGVLSFIIIVAIAVIIRLSRKKAKRSK